MALKFHTGFLATTSIILSFCCGALYLAARLTHNFFAVYAFAALGDALLRFCVIFLAIAGVAASWVFVFAPLILTLWHPFWEIRYRMALLDNRLADVEEALDQVQRGNARLE